MGWLLEVNVITFGFNRLTLSPTTVRTDPLLKVIVTVWECPRQKGLPHASEKCVDSRGTIDGEDVHTARLTRYKNYSVIAAQAKTIDCFILR